MEWQPVRGTRNLILHDAESGTTLHIVVRDPYMNEPNGTKYVVTGGTFNGIIYSSLAGAKAAAEASLESTPGVPCEHDWRAIEVAEETEPIAWVCALCDRRINAATPPS